MALSSCQLSFRALHVDTLQIQSEVNFEKKGRISVFEYEMTILSFNIHVN